MKEWFFYMTTALTMITMKTMKNKQNKYKKKLRKNWFNIAETETNYLYTKTLNEKKWPDFYCNLFKFTSSIKSYIPWVMFRFL